MSEKCPIRTVEVLLSDEGDFIDEVRIPEQCMGCIALAMANPANVTTTNSYEAGLKTLQESDGENVDPTEVDSWTNTAIHRPDETANRHAVYESGFDLKSHGWGYTGQSYEAGTETMTIDVEFVCPDN